MAETDFEIKYIRSPEAIHELLGKTKGIDETDLKIITMLQVDGRASFNTIGSKLGISTATVSKRVKKLRDHEVINGFSAIVSCDKIGFVENLWMMVCLEPGTDALKAGQEISRLPFIKNVYAVLSDFDILAHLCCATTEEASSVIQQLGKIKGVSKITKIGVYSKLKEEFKIIV
jgi:DNA-binding Lrp family transcriptional regulator